MIINNDLINTTSVGGTTPTDNTSTVPPVTEPTVKDLNLNNLTNNISPMFRIEHSVAPETQEKMLMNVLIILAVLAGLKLAQMVVFKAMQK